MVDMTTIENIYELPNTGCLLGKAYQAELSRLNSALKSAGLDISAAEYLILRVLYANGPIQQCEISRILDKDKASVNRSIHSLTKKGLVDTNPVSYKCSVVSLTREGEDLMPRLLKIAGKLQRDLENKITRQQMENLYEILRTIIK